MGTKPPTKEVGAVETRAESLPTRDKDCIIFLYQFSKARAKGKRQSGWFWTNDIAAKFQSSGTSSKDTGTQGKLLNKKKKAEEVERKL